MIQDIESKIDVEIVYALLSGKVTQALNRTLLCKLKEANIDVTPSQVAVLLTLWHKDGITQREIADRTAKDKPSITRILDELEKTGLTKRKNDKADRRSNKIYLTPKAETIREKVKAATIEALQEGWDGLNDKDIAKVQRLMKTIFMNLGGNKEYEVVKD